MKTKIVKIKDLKPFLKNPKKHWVEGISGSMKEFGYMEPIVVDENDMILAGHGRLKALKELKREEIEVIVREGLTEKQKEKYVLLSNKIVERGGWDYILLKDFEQDLLEEVGFESEEIDEIFEVEVEEDGFDSEEEYEKIKEPTTKSGDLFELGDHRLLCGDATKKEDVGKLMDREKADMVFTDPPYNINYHSLGGQSYNEGKYKGAKKKGVFSDKKTPEEYLQFLKDCILNCILYGQEKMAIFLWNGDRNLDIAIRACKESNCSINQLAVWIKNGFVWSPGCVFHKALEYCVIAFKEGKKPKINKKYAKYHSNLIDLDFDTFVEHLDGWFVKRDALMNYKHPTQKPVRLAEPALKACSERNNIVIDLFGGSGSTLIACEQLNRKCYMMELDNKYTDVIINRYCKYTNNYDIIKNNKPYKWQTKS